ncbi:DNA-binding FadR family transcriptional regulator [Sphingomonas zeicaulis]|uniref:FadR/GntR family transcriptional regulator n=1 Tax=Sphingomonas zeicaulis TaxID=1632740 RepID=UPI003D250B25
MASAPRKLYQRIAEEVASAIADRRYPPGSRLPGERDLAEHYAVSRPTIREAMIALEIRGLVEARQGSGIYVSAVPQPLADLPELDVGAFELVEARIMFEGEAAALAATAIEPAGLDALETALADMAAAAPGSPADLQADRHFHMLIAEATGNSLVQSVVEMLWNVRERSPLCVAMFDQARHEGVTPRVDEHRLIVEALRTRDPQIARQAMRTHLRRVTDDLLAATELELMQKAQAEAEAHRHRIARRAAL